MRTTTLLILINLCFQFSLTAQEEYFTRQGYVSFFSHTVVEDIRADNNQVLSVINTEDGEVNISILMKSFSFEKALMQEHFNENYVESDKYPKALFKGKIQNLEAIKNKESSIAEIKGELTIKDATQPIEIESKINFEENNIRLKGKFMVTVADYNIKIPAIVRRNIAKKIEVNFNFNHQPYNP